MNRNLKKAILEYPLFTEVDRIISREILLQYLTRRWRSSDFAFNFADILRSGRNSNLLTKGLELHELVELSVFQEKGVLEGILNGCSNKEYYREAHVRAHIEEISFYQKMGEIMFGRTIPYFAMLCAFGAIPQIREIGTPNRISACPKKAGRSDLIMPFNIEDVLLAVRLFELGGNDVSQIFRSVRTAREVENFVSNGRFSESPPDLVNNTGLDIVYNLNPNIIILGYGIRYADIKKKVFVGWLEYKKEESKNSRIDNWVAVESSIPTPELPLMFYGLSDKILQQFLTIKISEKGMKQLNSTQTPDLKSETGLNHRYEHITEPMSFLGYGIQYADIDNDIFVGWIRYFRRYRNVNRVYKNPWCTYKPVHTNVRESIHVIGPLQGFLDFKIDSYCAEKLKFQKSSDIPKDMGTF